MSYVFNEKIEDFVGLARGELRTWLGFLEAVTAALESIAKKYKTVVHQFKLEV